MSESEIAVASQSGREDTSHTLLVDDLVTLLAEVSRADADLSDYLDALVDHNVLGKETDGGRRRNFRYLGDLYLRLPDSMVLTAGSARVVVVGRHRTNVGDGQRCQ